MIRRKVLIACSDEALAFAVHRGLYGYNASVDVLLAGNAEVAREIADEHDLDLLLTDRIDETTGNPALVPWIASHAQATHLLLLCDERKKDALLTRMCSGSIHWLTPSTEPSTIAQRIAEILRTETHCLHGSLSTLSVADLVQITCLNRRALAIRVRNGSEHGTIFVRGGEVHHAVLHDGIVGENALYRLLRVSHGEFTTLAMLDELPRTIRRGWQELLLEGVRIQDELDHARETSQEHQFPAEALPEHERGDQFVPVPHRRRPRSTALGLLPTNPGSATARATQQLSPAHEAEVAKLIDDGFVRLRAGDSEGAKLAWESARKRDPHNRALLLNLRRLAQVDTSR